MDIPCPPARARISRAERGRTREAGHDEAIGIGTGRDAGAGAPATRHVTLLGGVRSLDEEWEPVDDQYALGLQVDESDAHTGHGYEAGVLIAHDDDSVLDPFFGLGVVDIESESLQAWAGWRHTFRPQERGVHPYLAAGLAVLWTSVEGSAAGVSVDDDDVAPAAYVRAGVAWDAGEATRVGLDYRHLFADEYELFGADIEGDEDQLVFTVGWGF